MMVAYEAEMNILHHANASIQNQSAASEATQRQCSEHSAYDMTVDETTEVWRRGSVISSWLLDLAANALHGSPGKFVVRVSDSGEGRWTVIAAVDEAVQAPVLAAALYERFGPHGEAEMADKVLSALRFRFGGY
jgi:6-phosphogluconate dehydrogenase